MELNAYIASSYNEALHISGYGLVFYFNNEEIDKLEGYVIKEIEYGSHQISGELEGTIKAIEYAIEQKYQSIKIYYNYIGIEKFLNNSFKKENANVVNDYIKKYNKLSSLIQINFEKSDNRTFFQKSAMKKCNQLAIHATTYARL